MRNSLSQVVAFIRTYERYCSAGKRAKTVATVLGFGAADHAAGRLVGDLVVGPQKVPVVQPIKFALMCESVGDVWKCFLFKALGYVMFPLAKDLRIR